MFIGWVVGQHNVGTGEARISLRGILVLQGALSLLLALLFASIDGCHPFMVGRRGGKQGDGADQ